LPPRRTGGGTLIPKYNEVLVAVGTLRGRLDGRRVTRRNVRDHGQPRPAGREHEGGGRRAELHPGARR
jgi:hypothetical protein